MCVVFIADQGVRPTEEMFRLGAAKNEDGGGVAWREQRDGQTIVCYEKGLTLEEMLHMRTTVPLPAVFHFRKTSSGTAQGPFGTHPFPVEKMSPYDLQGEASNGVLFHNGFYTGWKDKLIEAAIKGGWELPDGPYTDTRALALFAAHVGGGYLELAEEKLVWFQADAIRLYGNNWSEVQKITCSNTIWQYPTTTHAGGHGAGFPGAGRVGGYTGTPSTSPATTETSGTGKSEKTGGSSQLATFHRGSITGTAQDGSPQLEEVQTRNAEQIREGLVGEDRGSSEAGQGNSQRQLALVPAPQLCIQCGVARARSFYWTAAGQRVGKCWTCHLTFMGAQSGIMCQYCGKEPSTHVVNGENRLICKPCWIERGRPRANLIYCED